MASEIVIRNAVPEDYPGFRKMEEVAWQGTEVSIISENTFNTWLEVFPVGLNLALRDGEICGHVFAQICDFDPLDKRECRNWVEMTDNGQARSTHNALGNSLYVVSTSATHGGTGRILLRFFRELRNRLSMRFLAGACRMPGLPAFYPECTETEIEIAMVEEYVRLVNGTIKKCRRNNDPRVFDPVLSVDLRSIRELACGVVIKNYFNDAKSYNWACIIYCENK